MTKNQRMKIAKEKYINYCNSNDTCLEDVYKSYSIYKARAWSYCKELMQDYCGYNLRVISHNSNIFTAGFEFQDEFGVNYFMYITPTYDIMIEV